MNLSGFLHMEFCRLTSASQLKWATRLLGLARRSISPREKRRQFESASSCVCYKGESTQLEFVVTESVTEYIAVTEVES